MPILLSLALAGPLGPLADDVVAVELPETPVEECDDAFPYQLEQVPNEADILRLFQPARSWGTPTMVDTLINAFGRVATLHPDADPVFVGDLSTHKGGALPPHRWHHDGRSADLGLFMGEGQQPVHGFMPVWGAQLDVARTWTLVESLLATGNVEHILLDQAHVKRLLEHVREHQLLEPAEIARTFPDPDAPGVWAMRGIVRHAANHRDHLHVRLSCASDAAAAAP